MTLSARRARVPPITTVGTGGATNELDTMGAAMDVASMLPGLPIELEEGLSAGIEVAPGSSAVVVPPASAVAVACPIRLETTPEI